jgi:hypothetical protein
MVRTGPVVSLAAVEGGRGLRATRRRRKRLETTSVWHPPPNLTMFDHTSSSTVLRKTLLEI